MPYTGYVADIDRAIDAHELNFESTDYQETEAALVSAHKIRLEWMEGDEFWAVTIDHIYETDGVEFGTGTVECSYSSWEGRRNTVRRDLGSVEATFIAIDEDTVLLELEEFWIDVQWTTGAESGRLIFELSAEEP